MSDFSELYRQELEALYRNGADFACDQPQLARGLAAAARDPDLEQLLHGMAFVGARMRQLHDAEFPQLARHLLHSLYPAALRPVPACSVVAFRPAANSRFDRLPVNAGAALEAEDEAGRRYRFQTTADVELLALSVSACRLTPRGEGAVLDLELTVSPEANWSPPDSLRLFLNAPWQQALVLYRVLTSRLTAIDIATDEQVFEVSPHNLQPWGFAPWQALLPDDGRDPPALRLLREYFTCREKFLFLHLQLPATLGRGRQPRRLRIAFHLRELPPGLPAVDEELLVLHATPVCNLYPVEARPFVRDVPGGDWPLQPDRDGDGVMIWGIDEVSGCRSDHGEVTTFTPVEAGADHPAAATGAWCLQACRPSRSGRDMEWFLSFPVTAGDHDAGTLRPWTMSATLLCTDGEAPRRLAPGDIRHAAGNGLEYVTFTNLLPVRGGYPPDTDVHQYWRLVSEVVAGLGGLPDLAALRHMLELTNVPVHSDHAAMARFRQRLDALLSLRWQPTLRYLHGAAVVGCCCLLTLQPRSLGDGDEWYLFGSVLARALASLAPVNSFHELHLLDAAGTLLAAWHAQPQRGAEGVSLWTETG